MDYKQSLGFALKTLENCLKADYGSLFTSQFKTDDDLNEWKKRIWVKMMGLHPQDILDGYEAITDDKTRKMPNVPDLVQSTLESQKKRIKREKNQVESESIALLPKPEVKIDKKRIFDLIREYMGDIELTENKEQKKERLERLKQKTIDHQDMITRFLGNIKYVIEPSHECNVGHCLKAGTISSSTTGNGNYYCAEHYRKSF